MTSTIPALPVRDVPVAVGHYRDRFGFQAPHVESDFAVLVRDDAVLHLWSASDEGWRSREDLTAQPICSGAESFLAGTASCRIEVEDVDGLFAELEPQGVLHGVSRGGVHDTDFGTREFATVDLDGNLLTFFRWESQTAAEADLTALGPTGRTNTDERMDLAKQLYERAVFGGDASALGSADRKLDEVEADLSLARGRIIHARFLEEEVDDPQELVLFERAVELYQALGDARGEGESLFWVGIFHQVVREDNDAAVPVFTRSYELATQVGDKLTLSYALRHLGIAEYTAGRFDTARARLEESVQLRRELGFLPGVAANLVGLAYIAAADGRRDDVRPLLEEARVIAEANDAHGILRWIEEARDSLLTP